MQVEVIYHQGRLEFVHPIKLKHDHLRLVVLVPDEEIETPKPAYQLPAEDLVRVQSMLAKYQAIIDAPFLSVEDLPEFGDEYLERLEAIDLRAQIRQEQGRPV